MADIVNLRMARKAKARAADKAEARANRALHGRTREERKTSEAEIARIARTVDGAKRED
ncbi:DUF4169 family protein [Novosphingobium malaysiense]|uniref:DUF4169 family protein n=1 Tax=Novosphingobium malaysiense TaxID=1348853 RepID=UPI0009DF917E|nr:DUF4169 family protein [Novosphingobium malaysiense]